MANCVIFGADGFIGSHVAAELAERGHRVRAFDRYQGKPPRNLSAHKLIEPFDGDFLNRHDLDEALQGMAYVFHFISLTTPASSGQDPLVDVETNIRMSVELFELCRQHKVKRVIFSSSGGAIYGRDQERLFSEEDLAQPMSPYAIGKLAIEGFLRYFEHAHGLDYLSLRLSNPYGERQNLVGSQGVIPIFLNLIRQDKPITLYGDGHNVRDYIYIKDMIQMMAEIFDRPTEHHVYNIGSGQAVSLNELIAALGTITGRKVRVAHKPQRPTDIDRVCLDMSRYRNEFRPSPTTSLEEGLRTTWEYVSSLKPKSEATSS